MPEEIDYAARVQRGAALLDEKWPTWVQDIDVEKLDIGSGCSCATAQYYVQSSGVDMGDGNWQYGKQALGLNEVAYAAHGFIGEYDEDEDGNPTRVPERVSADLTAIWRDLIIQRRAIAQPEASER